MSSVHGFSLRTGLSAEQQRPCGWRIVISPMIPRPASILRCAIRTNFSEREPLPTTLHEGTARDTYFPVLFKSPLFYLLEVVRPERLELPAFWFVAR